MDWTIHIEEREQPAHEAVAVVRGTEVEVGAVLALIADGWTVPRIVGRFPKVTDEDVRACAAYAKEIMEREALRRFVQAGVESPGLTPEAEVWSQHEREFGPLDDDSGDP